MLSLLLVISYKLLAYVLFVFYCRMIQNSFIDMESMFKLFEEEEEVPGGCLVLVFTLNTVL